MSNFNFQSFLFTYIPWLKIYNAMNDETSHKVPSMHIGTLFKIIDEVLNHYASKITV